ncbi:hypothetical protein [Maritalea mediterranea]|uniref:Uncharacterized protein n=1 Tax=Maritalea mediterranea TaxID=2909667 RepID=A0ABS9E969_9HYPH|nr:hypothetical protein [Maritalea mediterranea]MCF4097953.1 hypothetical protein [Maritalea mediterranea]
MPQLSVGFCTSPLFFEHLALGVAQMQRLFASVKIEHLIQTRPTSVFARLQEHIPLLEFAEGAAIHAEIVCERRVHATTDGEQLVFPEALQFDTEAILPAIDRIVSDEHPFTLLNRSELDTSNIAKNGRFTARAASQTFSANRVLMLDPDMIHDELAAHPQATPIAPQWQHIIRFHQQKAPTFASQLDISTGLWRFELGAHDILFSAPGTMDQLATHLIKYHGEIVDRRVRQFDQILMMNTLDGYPVCDTVGARQVLCFAGAQQFGLALVPTLAEQLTKQLTGNSTPKDSFWGHAQLGKNRGGEGSLLRALGTQEDA